MSRMLNPRQQGKLSVRTWTTCFIFSAFFREMFLLLLLESVHLKCFKTMMGLLNAAKTYFARYGKAYKYKKKYIKNAHLAVISPITIREPFDKRNKRSFFMHHYHHQSKLRRNISHESPGGTRKLRRGEGIKVVSAIEYTMAILRFW